MKEVVYDAPEVILGRVKALEDEISKGISELEDMLRG